MVDCGREENLFSPTCIRTRVAREGWVCGMVGRTGTYFTSTVEVVMWSGLVRGALFGDVPRVMKQALKHRDSLEGE